ncbi:unnamed protein product [Urochloa humidicola]
MLCAPPNFPAPSYHQIAGVGERCGGESVVASLFVSSAWRCAASGLECARLQQIWAWRRSGVWQLLIEERRRAARDRVGCVRAGGRAAAAGGNRPHARRPRLQRRAADPARSRPRWHPCGSTAWQSWTGRRWGRQVAAAAAAAAWEARIDGGRRRSTANPIARQGGVRGGRPRAGAAAGGGEVEGGQRAHRRRLSSTTTSSMLSSSTTSSRRQQ